MDPQHVADPNRRHEQHVSKRFLLSGTNNHIGDASVLAPRIMKPKQPARDLRRQFV